MEFVKSTFPPLRFPYEQHFMPLSQKQIHRCEITNIFDIHYKLFNYCGMDVTSDVGRNCATFIALLSI